MEGYNRGLADTYLDFEVFYDTFNHRSIEEYKKVWYKEVETYHKLIIS